jgi:DNA-binding MarR family transcriptional regulator
MQDEVSLMIADVYEAAGALRMSGEAIARAENVKLAQWHLLDAIEDSTMTVARIARRVGHARQSVQKTANELADAGFIEFDDNPDHKNSPLLRVTESGEQLRTRLHRRAKESHEARFADLSPAQIIATRDTLQAMARATYELHG